MKKAQAALGIVLIVVILLGCIDKTNANQQLYSQSEGTETEIIWPVQTLNMSDVLKNNTVYDEDGYYIVMPKGTKIAKLTNGNIWTINTNRYLIQFQIFKLSDTLNAESFKTAPALIKTIKKAMESNSNNAIQLNDNYRIMQFDGKNSILINGKVRKNNLLGDINVYLIDSKSSLLFLSVVKIQNNTWDITARISMEANAMYILNNLKIKSTFIVERLQIAAFFVRKDIIVNGHILMLIYGKGRFYEEGNYEKIYCFVLYMSNSSDACIHRLFVKF